MWNSHWTISGIEVPLPPARENDRTGGRPGGWDRRFAFPRGAIAEWTGFWDAWATSAGLRAVVALGDDTGVRRLYDDGSDLGVLITAVHEPGARMAEVTIHVERRSELPASLLVDGALQVGALTIPVPGGAIPDFHEDDSNEGGEDRHGFRVPALTVTAARELYLPWAVLAGFDHSESEDENGDNYGSLSLSRADGLGVYISVQRTGDDPATLVVAVSKSDSDRSH